ncbi:TetR/AcrR family transcriptional regulator [Nanchangia anserum]|uniref:TetR/AcrR family transcriptional regulator n=2 Tax=Nanchangia anserum TaxID=2692125 RepID=A0A8I0GA61_9ACTO|nr:TetR/AcrR family transcriptional regulator [Nanchangia anserum]MBD3689984.1 TetR/AcrR family transcriptional regulator [Nanchangia anserum]QOX82567.1 TetR/AcrR family transcriptional regulator [Nanchangia anserum]
MTGLQRREQLITVARSVFAANGYEATSMEEIAQAAHVSKPVVYEHFGGKEAIYAVVVDREVQRLVSSITEALLTSTSPRQMAEQAALALLDFIETNSDGFRIMVRDAPPTSTSGTYWSVIGDVAVKVQAIVAKQFKESHYNPDWAPMYAQMLVGMVSQVGQWWLDVRKPDKYEVAAHLANLAWLGMRHLSHNPTLLTTPTKK